MVLATLFLGLATLSPAADAEPSRTLFGRPVPDRPELTEAEVERRRAAFQQSLADEGWVKQDDLVVPQAFLTRGDVADRRTQHHQEGWSEDPHRASVFLNFFGGPLTRGANAAEGESQCVRAGDIEYPAYQGTEAKALTMIEIFESRMEPYGVRIHYADVPPKHLPYSMVMMGGRPEDIGLERGALGVSCAPDCGDLFWRDTTFAFTEVSNQSTTLGYTALQEAAHAWGLAHIDGTDNIMYPVATPGAKGWSQECTPFNDSTGGINCRSTHRLFCPDGESQNDNAELLAFFGPNSPDDEAPVAVIVSPEDGAELPAGEEIEVDVEVEDNFGGAGWHLEVIAPNGDTADLQAYRQERGFKFSLSDGTYTLRLNAIDHDLNEGSDEITIIVGDADGNADGGTDGEDEGEDAEADGEGGSTGRGCRASDVPTWSPWLAFGVVVLRRRRR